MPETTLQSLYDALAGKLALETTVENLIRSIRVEPCVLGDGKAPAVIMESAQPVFHTIQIYYPLSGREYTRVLICGGLVRFNLANLYNNKTRILYSAADRLGDALFFFGQIDLPAPPDDMAQAYLLLAKYMNVAGHQMGIRYKSLENMA